MWLQWCYIIVSATVTVPNTAAAGAAANNRKNITFKNCTPFTKCISEIKNTQIDNAKDIDIVIPVYKLIEYTQPPNIGPKDVPKMSPSSVARSCPKDPIWPSPGRHDLTSWGRPNLTSWGRPEMTSKGRPNLVFKRFP